jgi:Zn-dependent membrane protease YugP
MLLVPLVLMVTAFLVSNWALGRYQSRMSLGRRSQAPEDLTGAEIALEFLKAHGVTDVQVVAHDGVVTDYFDPMRRRLFLSRDIREGSTLAAWALALHEAAHALQTGEDRDALLWRRTCVRLTRYIPVLALFGVVAMMFFMKLPFRVTLPMLVGMCVLVLVLNAGTLAIEHNANARLKRWLEDRLSGSPSAQERLDILLAAIATRELGDFVQSPRYFFFSALPGSSSPRPK